MELTCISRGRPLTVTWTKTQNIRVKGLWLIFFSILSCSFSLYRHFSWSLSLAFAFFRLLSKLGAGLAAMDQRRQTSQQLTWGPLYKLHALLGISVYFLCFIPALALAAKCQHPYWRCKSLSLFYAGNITMCFRSLSFQLSLPLEIAFSRGYIIVGFFATLFVKERQSSVTLRLKQLRTKRLSKVQWPKRTVALKNLDDTLFKYIFIYWHGTYLKRWTARLSL